MRNLPMDLLRTFCTVAQLQSFTSAGNVLGRSQPAISLQIKKLEEILDQPLLTRSGKSLSLTQSGERLLAYAKDILAMNDAAFNDLSHNKITGHIRLGIPNEFAASALPEILAGFKQSNPNVQLEVNCDLSHTLLNDLNSGQYDVIVALHSDASVPSAGDPYLDGGLTLREDEIQWVGNPELMPGAQEALPLIVAPNGCLYRHAMETQLKVHQIPWKITYTSSSHGGLSAAVTAGLGISALAQSSLRGGDMSELKDDRLPKLGNLTLRAHAKQSRNAVAVDGFIDFVNTALAN